MIMEHLHVCSLYIKAVFCHRCNRENEGEEDMKKVSPGLVTSVKVCVKPGPASEIAEC